MLVTLLNIRKPTMMSAGAVAKEGIAVKIGAKNMEIRKRIAVTSAVRPVLPPAATPEADSTKVVVVEVPRSMNEAQREALRKFAEASGKNYNKKKGFFGKDKN